MTELPLALEDVRAVQLGAFNSLSTANILINRSYLEQLGSYPIHDSSDLCSLFSVSGDLRIFRIERISQGNMQSVLESTTAAYTALGAAGYTVFLYLCSNGLETELYIGTRGNPGAFLGQHSGDMLKEAFNGHFPGSLFHSLKSDSTLALLDKLKSVKEDKGACITAVTSVPALSTDNREHFIQGLEHFIDAAEHRTYQALILAEPFSTQQLDMIRAGFEQASTQLSPLLKQQIAYGMQDSDSVGLSIGYSLSSSLGESLSLTETRGTSHTVGTSSSETHGSSVSTSKQSAISKGASVVGSIGGGSIGFVCGNPIVGAQIGSSIASVLNKSETTTVNESITQGRSENYGTSRSESEGRTKSTTHTEGSNENQSINRTMGSNRQISIEVVDKSIEQLLKRIDGHLQRIDEARTYGGWNAAAYFIGDSRASSETLASIFLGLIRGTKSSHENFALTSWESENKSKVIDWLTCFSHPQLKPQFESQAPITSVTPATLVSGREVAILLSIPRHSTSTVTVVKPQIFGRKVHRMDGLVLKQNDERRLTLGKIQHLWRELPQNLELNIDQLASHVFVCGSTGAGKSNALYEILRQINEASIPFLVIEPAKGEYKHIFGHRDDVCVLGTNPLHSALLHINPFRFPSSIHVLEHVDRLIEIFNVCWPMYAAMPAVLKDAILQAYQACGWNLDNSCNIYDDELFPTFIDLLDKVHEVIENSAYSQELKGNYIGSLSTRIRSLTNGLNGQIFSVEETDNDLLFNSNVIVDLSRIGSVETKALIMGILVMRLTEYRLDRGGMNQQL